ncbi:MAG: VWA domain-containing protein [Capsulimonadaceae bacterium]
MSSSLNVRVSLSHPYIPSSTYLEEPQYALLDIHPSLSESDSGRPPLNLAFVIDSSATMHHFQFSDDEREYWIGVASSRNELERGKADERDAIYWTGQTLREMQAVARKPMVIVTEALKNLFITLQHSDRVSVIAFADKVHPLFGDQDWTAFPERCSRQLDLLRDQTLPVDIGTGTYMADAVLKAGEYLSRNKTTQSVNRLIIITDGIVQDPMVTLNNISSLQETGYAITTVGVGEEFDEEFLIRVADNSRGEYHYASTADDITECLQNELNALQATSVTDMYMAVRGVNGSVVQEMFMVRPAMSLFDEIFTEEDWLRARIGDVSTTSPLGVLVQFVPANAANGTRNIAEIHITYSYPTAAFGISKGNEKVLITGEFTSDPSMIAKSNPTVIDLVDRFCVYRYEREAQRAQEKGDLATAKEKLGQATKQLRQLGETALADDMEAQIASIGTRQGNPTRVKRIKSTTRRLASMSTLPPES